MKIYDFTVKDKKGEDFSLKEYEGKVLLVVNTATQCGLTPQYEGLQKLYDLYKSKGFEILDFPCNQFLEQAPGSNEEISAFCSINYGTTFPRFSKVEINGPNTHPLYAWLKEEIQEARKDEEAQAFEEKVKQYTPGIQPADIKWNFGKFLIDKEGNVVARFSPALSLEVVEEEISKLL